MPTNQNIIAGLDIGSGTMRIAVGQKLSDEMRRCHIIGVAEVPSGGISRGVVTSIDEAVSSISTCLDKIERVIGNPIENVWVGISGNHIISQDSKGVVAIAKPNGEIAEGDIERSVEAARTVATPPNYEILHVIPKSFTVDGQSGIRDPRGMTGIRLEVDTQIIQGLSSQIKNITKAIYRTGLEIEDLVLSILGTSEAVLNSRQKQLGCVVINIGSSTTSMAVYEEGDVLHTSILPIGSEHITSDIAIGLRISIDLAEKVKLEYGDAISKEINKREEVNIGELGGGDNYFVSKKYISEIIEARVEEIFTRVDGELKKIDRSGSLPAGIVLTGGGAKLQGVVEAAKASLRLPASMGFPIDITSTTDKVNDVTYSTAVGLVLWGMQIQAQKAHAMGGMFSKLKIDSFSKKIKKFLKTFGGN